MKYILFSVITISVLITGCASGPVPKNATEYRDAIKKGGFGTNFENYVVERSYSKVAETLKKNANACLNKKVEKTKCPPGTLTCEKHTAYYTPTIKSSKQKTELHVQWRRDHWGDKIALGETPPDGLYITVVDVMPAGKGKTEVNLYGPSLEHLQTVPKAIKHWVDGSNLGCPNLGKPYYY